jgi:hypothetical protein
MRGHTEKDNRATLAELKLGLVMIIDRMESVYLQAKCDYTNPIDAGKLFEHTPSIIHDLWDAIVVTYDDGPTEFYDGWPHQSLAERTREFIDHVNGNNALSSKYFPSEIVEEDGVTIKPKVFNDLRLKITEDHKPVEMPMRLSQFVEQIIKSITHFSSINPT